jgi:NADH-quinone oxidoreductase subunit M
MLLAMLALYFNTNPNTFDMTVMMAQANTYSTQILPFWPFTDLRWGFQHVVWIALFIGFAIKIPAFPFHTWLPDAHVEAPTAISVILAGVLLKMGTYGILRINYPMMPVATADMAYWLLGALGAWNIIYGALCAMAQTDLKKLVAYSSVSHMGYVMLGMASFTTQGINGAVLQMFNHGTITAMLFLLVGVIYDRAHHRDNASVYRRYRAGGFCFDGFARAFRIYLRGIGFARHMAEISHTGDPWRYRCDSYGGVFTMDHTACLSRPHQ